MLRLIEIFEWINIFRSLFIEIKLGGLDYILKILLFKKIVFVICRYLPFAIFFRQFFSLFLAILISPFHYTLLSSVKILVISKKYFCTVNYYFGKQTYLFLYYIFGNFFRVGIDKV